MIIHTYVKSVKQDSKLSNSCFVFPVNHRRFKWWYSKYKPKFTHTKKKLWIYVNCVVGKIFDILCLFRIDYNINNDAELPPSPWFYGGFFLLFRIMYKPIHAYDEKPVTNLHKIIAWSLSLSLFLPDLAWFTLM